MARATTNRPVQIVFQGLNLLLALIVLSIGLVVIVAGPAVAEQFATLHPLEGTVEVSDDGEDFADGREGQVLSAGDTIRTGSAGRAEIEYFDDSITRLDDDTTFVLQELSSDPDVPRSKTIVAEQQEGRTFERVVTITDSESRFDVETPTATASVQGTTYVLNYLPDGTAVIWVIPDEDPEEGEVVFILEDGTEQVVREGQGVVAFPDGTFGEPFDLTDEQLNDLWVLFNQCQLDELDLPACEEEEPELPPDDGDDQDKDEPEPSPQPPPPDETSFVATTTETTGGGDGDGDGGDGGDGGADDTKPPKTTITEAPPGFTKSRDATFRFQANEPVKYFECSLDGGTFGRCTSGRTYVGLGDGTHLFSVRATDKAGNSENTASHQWTIDNVAPVTDITEGPENEPPTRSGRRSRGTGASSSAADATFEFQSNEDPNVTFECRLDEGEWKKCTSPHTEQDVETGQHVFEARATDRAGNLGDPDAWGWCEGAFYECFGEGLGRQLDVTGTVGDIAGQLPGEVGGPVGEVIGTIDDTVGQVQETVDTVTETVEDVVDVVPTPDAPALPVPTPSIDLPLP